MNEKVTETEQDELLRVLLTCDGVGAAKKREALDKLIAYSEARAVEPYHSMEVKTAMLIKSVTADRDQLLSECEQLKEQLEFQTAVADNACAFFGQAENRELRARAEKAEEALAQLSHAAQMERTGLAIEEEKVATTTQRGRSLAVMCNAYLEPIADQLEHCHNSPNEAKAIRQLLDEARTILADGGAK